MKKLFALASMVGITFSGLVQAQQWDHGVITLAGKFEGKYLIKVDNIENTNNQLPSFTNQFFTLSDSVGVDGYAVALAAITSKRQIYFNSNIDDYGTQYPIIQIIYLTDKLTPISN
jgi:hypothetical protein